MNATARAVDPNASLSSVRSMTVNRTAPSMTLAFAPRPIEQTHPQRAQATLRADPESRPRIGCNPGKAARMRGLDALQVVLACAIDRVGSGSRVAGPAAAPAW